MAKIIEFPKKPSTSYAKRTTDCINVYKTTGKLCQCKTCIGKRTIVERLIAVSNYLCLDYVKNNNDPLYYSDWLEIMLTATLRVENIVYPK